MLTEADRQTVRDIIRPLIFTAELVTEAALETIRAVDRIRLSIFDRINQWFGYDSNVDSSQHFNPTQEEEHMPTIATALAAAAAAETSEAHEVFAALLHTDLQARMLLGQTLPGAATPFDAADITRVAHIASVYGITVSASVGGADASQVLATLLSTDVAVSRLRGQGNVIDLGTIIRLISVFGQYGSLSVVYGAPTPAAERVADQVTQIMTSPTTAGD